MNQYSEYAGITGDVDCPHQRIAQQRLPDSLIMVALIDGEPTEQQDWQRVWHVAPHRLGRRLMADSTGRQAVITNDGRAYTYHEAARSASRMVLERALFEPFVQG